MVLQVSTGLWHSVLKTTSYNFTPQDSSSPDEGHRRSIPVQFDHGEKSHAPIKVASYNQCIQSTGLISSECHIATSLIFHRFSCVSF